MNINEKIEYALDLKMHQGYNCAQAVTCALKDEIDLDEIYLKEISSAFCAGMGNLKGTCGALIGVLMILGLKTKGLNTLKLSKDISDRFENLSGALVCKDLKSIKDDKPLCSCNNCIKNAIMAYYEIVS